MTEVTLDSNSPDTSTFAHGAAQVGRDMCGVLFMSFMDSTQVHKLNTQYASS